jgi:hypothetical protein
VKSLRLISILVLLTALALTTAGPAMAQCAMCKTVLLGSPEGRAFSQQLDRAILLMFFAPYLVFGTLAAVLFRRPLSQRLGELRARFFGRPPGSDHGAV